MDNEGVSESIHPCLLARRHVVPSHLPLADVCCELLNAVCGTRIFPSMEATMKAKTIVLALVLCFVGVAMGYAVDAFMGTWKLNEAKSTLAAGTPKNNTVVYEAAGDNVKITVDGVDSEGKPAHNEWTGKFDGKEYPVTGDPTADMRSYKRVNDRTLTLTNKKNGKTTMSGRIVISKDGKSRTVTVSGTDAAGKKISSTAVYDKQ
jgi:hypothetical protein